MLSLKRGAHGSEVVARRRWRGPANAELAERSTTPCDGPSCRGECRASQRTELRDVRAWATDGCDRRLTVVPAWLLLPGYATNCRRALSSRTRCRCTAAPGSVPNASREKARWLPSDWTATPHTRRQATNSSQHQGKGPWLRNDSQDSGQAVGFVIGPAVKSSMALLPPDPPFPSATAHSPSIESGLPLPS